MDGTRDITLAPASSDELHRTAFLHVTQLPHGLFPLLGQRFVRRWQRAHLRSDHGVVLVAKDGAEVVGFLLGTTDRRANVGWIIEHHRAELLTSGLLAMVLRPWLIGPFLRTRGRRYARKIFGPRSAGPAGPVAPPEPHREGDAGPVAVLEAVVVDYPGRGNGIGTALVEAFLERAASVGVHRVELVTKADARGAADFYERAGWHCAGRHTDRDGDEVATYRIDLHSARSVGR